MYSTNGELEKEGCSFTEDSIYRSVTLGRGQLHEVVIRIEEPQTVITWDFDVMRQDVMFSVLVTHVLLPIKESSSHSCDLEYKSALDKNWKEGKEYSKVETPIVCHDGESVQVRIKIAIFLCLSAIETPLEEGNN